MPQNFPTGNGAAEPVHALGLGSTVDDLKPLTGLPEDARLMIWGVGIFRYDPDATDPADDETCVECDAGGRFFLVSISAEEIYSNLVTRITALEEYADGRLTGQATIDFGSVAAYSFATSTFALPGAIKGSPVVVGVDAAINLAISGRVDTDDNVTIIVHNNTAGAIDPSLATYRVIVYNVHSG